MKKKNNRSTDVKFTKLIVFIWLSIFVLICSIKVFKTSNENNNEIVVRDILGITEEESQNIKSEIDEQIENIETIEPHIDEETGVEYITYEDIGIVEQGKDSYKVMKKTHEIANKYGYEVRATLSEYHIYKLDDLSPIYIQTNTNWNNAKFIIHDEEIKDYESRNYSIFEISSYKKNIIITDENILKEINLNKKTEKIEQLKRYGTCLCKVYNSNKKQYIRSGVDRDNGNAQVDFFRIDNEGEVLNDILWDFENITKIELIPIPEEQLIVQNGNFQTNLDKEQYEPESEYWKRNIRCYRSNTILKNINHLLDNEDNLGGTYAGFLTILNSSKVEIVDCKLTAHKYKKASNYDFLVEYVTDMTLNGVVSDYIESTNKWGITGTNYTKDITYKNCVLNRIDAHCGVHNLIIDNCIIGVKGITLNGSGKLKITNTKRMGESAFINLRSDYGSTWDGDIEIVDCEYSNMNKTNQLISFRTVYDSEKQVHDYGYDLHLPNVTIDGLKINEENINNNELYMFDNNPSITGTENGDMRNAYNLPTSINIKNYESTSGRKIKLFSNKFYDNLEELGIDLSMPLSDGKKIRIVDDNGNELDDNAVVGNFVKITKEDVEGIQTTLKINSNEVSDYETVISDEGIHMVQAIYQNTNGDKLEETKTIIIDKTPPTVEGVENNSKSFFAVTPTCLDEDFREAKLFKDDEEIEYELGTQIEEEGKYKLVVTDKVGNETIIEFELINTLQYSEYINTVFSRTTLKEFIEESESNKNIKIYKKDGTELEENEFVGTGMRVQEEKDGEIKNTFTLIVKGDVDGNGKATATDLAVVNQIILKEFKNEEPYSIALDINNDGKITATDLSAVNQMVLKEF